MFRPRATCLAVVVNPEPTATATVYTGAVNAVAVGSGINEHGGCGLAARCCPW